MPWKESSTLNEREKFINSVLTERVPFSELCAQYGISRKTGYKWVERYNDDGRRGLKDQSRRPLTTVNAAGEDAIIQAINIKQKHMTWGPKKIRQVIIRNLGEAAAPSVSSVHRILKKANLVKKRRVRSVNPTSRIQNRIEATECNDVWSVDFKGWWMTKDIRKCTPLTITDRTSRMVIRAQRVDHMTTKAAQAVFESAFKEHGLPKVIRSDNGTPFATTNAPHGLSRLSVWWMSLGILPDRIDPGKPSQNGGHERMHRDLKAEVQKTVLVDLAESQPALDAWRKEFNEERPDEAIGMQTPAKVYTPSPRKYEPFDELQYPEGFVTRKVSGGGKIKLDSSRIHISTVFSSYHLGLKPVDEKTMAVWLGEFHIGNIDLIAVSFSAEGIKI